MTKRRVYARPPLVEALCQFQFEPGQEWDIAIPGLFYNEVKLEFPERHQQRALEVLFDQGTGQAKQSSAARIQFRRSDGTALVQIGPDLLIVNVLYPYPGWETFRGIVLTSFESYCSVAQPVGLKAMSLRYINRIRLPSPSVEIEDYLRFSPSVPSGLPQVFVGWAQSVSIPLDEKAILRINAGSTRDESEADTIFVLDIESSTAQMKSLESMEAEITRSHDVIEKAFEECVTDRARSIFLEEVSLDREPATSA